MKQPKVYIKHLDIVSAVETVNFHEKTVEVFFYDNLDNVPFNFDEVTFIYNTGYKDKSGNYIYTGDILEYQAEANKYYVSKVLVEKDGEQEFYYLTNNGNFVSRLMNMDDYSIIGNIYENKDLLDD